MPDATNLRTHSHTRAESYHVILHKRDIATLLGISTRTLNRWIASGKLPFGYDLVSNFTILHKLLKELEE